MTILNCTVSRHTAAICQDTAVSIVGQAAGLGQKLWTFPHRRMAMGSTGSLYLANHVAAHLTSPAPGDIAMINRDMPAILRRLYDSTPDALKSLGLLIALVGFDDALDQCVGFIYDSQDGFAPRQIDATVGHFIQPAQLDETDPTYAVIQHRRNAALNGTGLEAFHQHLAANQFAGWKKGLVQSSTAIGGELMFAKVDQHGATISKIARLSNYDELKPFRRNLSLSHEIEHGRGQGCEGADEEALQHQLDEMLASMTPEQKRAFDDFITRSTTP